MAPSSPKSITELDDIPTLHDIYTADELAPSDKEQEEDDETEYTADEALNKRVSIWRGDITVLKAGMIVNAANSSLLGGGGVDGAIHRAAGRRLLEECETLGGAETGETKVTGAYNLPSTYIAHTVGPVYSRRDPDDSKAELESCYRTSLEHCKDKQAESIGFSSISTGIYGYPIEDATHVALRQTRLALEEDDRIKRVVYVVFSAKDERVYRSLAPIYFPPPPSTQTSQPARESTPAPEDIEDAASAPETVREGTAEPAASEDAKEPAEAAAKEA